MKFRTEFAVLLLSLVGATSAPSARLDDASILQYLNHSIDWYRRVSAVDQSPLNTQEFVYQEIARANARQTLRLAFDFAKAAASTAISRPAPTTGKSASGRSLASAAAATADRIAALQLQLDDTSRSIGVSSPTSRPALEARRDKLNSAIDLARTQLTVLNEYAGFVTNTENGAGGLAEKIEDLRRSVPEIAAEADVATDTPVSSALPATRPTAANLPVQVSAPVESSGILAIVSRMFTLTGRIADLSTVSHETDTLHEHVDKIRQPIRQSIIDAVRRGTEITEPATQESADPQQIDAQRRELDGLSTQFKQLAAAGVPLGEQSVLLDSARQNLDQWRSALETDYARAVRSLLFRVVAMGAVILVLIIISVVWQRATYRYVHDARRRRQLMFIRRLVIGFIVVLIIIGSVVTEFGSLATFAGLITAGIAVSLQTVILSGVAYFFFIGRYGVRVGDRVTVNGISGDVVEVGLFRLYLLELAGKAPDLHATGRIVVFSNAVLFQPSAFYKQVPGAEYVWHEMALTLAPDGNHRLAETRLMAAVETVFNEYRETVERQHQTVMNTLHISMPTPKPEGRLRFVDAGIEYVIRYPVTIHASSATDDRITRALLDAIELEPKLKLVVSGTPTIQSVA